MTCAPHNICMCQNVLCHVVALKGCQVAEVAYSRLKMNKRKNSITVSKSGDPAEFALLSMKSCQLGLPCSQKSILSKITNDFASIVSNVYEVMSRALLRKGKEKQSVRTNTLLIQKVCHICDLQLQIVHLAASHVYKCMFLQRELSFHTSLPLK